MVRRLTSFSHPLQQENSPASIASKLLIAAYITWLYKRTNSLSVV